jgi:hypothetical protein
MHVPRQPDPAVRPAARLALTAPPTSRVRRLRLLADHEVALEKVHRLRRWGLVELDTLSGFDNVAYLAALAMDISLHTRSRGRCLESLCEQGERWHYALFCVLALHCAYAVVHMKERGLCCTYNPRTIMSTTAKESFEARDSNHCSSKGRNKIKSCCHMASNMSE